MVKYVDSYYYYYFYVVYPDLSNQGNYKSFAGKLGCEFSLQCYPLKISQKLQDTIWDGHD